MITQRLHLVLLVAVLGLLLVGCTPAPAANPSGSAEKATSGEITVYTALEDDQIARYLPLFNEKYPNIKVNIVRDSPASLRPSCWPRRPTPRPMRCGAWLPPACWSPTRKAC